jgi:hypothetical protein
VAAPTVNSIAGGNAEGIVSVSRPAEYDCSGIVRELFPGCETAEVLEGYAFASGPFPGTHDVLSKTDYLDRLVALFASIDADYRDKDGDGGPSVLGIKKCGGSWNITWTAAIRNPGEPAERMGAFFEFVSDGPDSDVWYTEGLWLMPLEYPNTGVNLSLEEIACDAPTLSWPSQIAA